ncbi:MAG: hypothetical protein KJ593_03975 [Candidatus Omnitrophica bacterium]|nr:hypothetical protein [Candidatus Omnitrophota bacterium]
MKPKNLKFSLAVFLSAFFLLAPIVFADDTAREVEFTYTIHNERDPFLPFVTPDGYIVNLQAQTEIADINLEGIIFDAQGRSLAVINGDVIAENEFVGEFQLKEIKKDKIILQNGQKTYIIELTKEGASED